MRLSFQTVSIVFGVTLVHLFVIAAFSPTEGEWSGSFPKFEIDPALELLPDEAIAAFETVTDLANTDDAAEPVTPLQNTPGEDSAPVEMTDLRTNSSTQEKVNDEPAAMPVQNLAEIEGPKEAPAGNDETVALRQPPRQIREIRSLQPIPRS